jgi:hypothetical protein
MIETSLLEFFHGWSEFGMLPIKMAVQHGCVVVELDDSY